MSLKQVFRVKGLTQGWEFWPWYYIYIPISGYRLFNSIRFWSFSYLYSANPGMPPVKPLQFSKWHILQQLPPEVVPKTLVVEDDTADGLIQQTIKDFGDICVAKPDVGERGNEVKVLHSFEEVVEYRNAMKGERFLLQELIETPIELGVMYYRYPDSPHGEVTGITGKEFFTVQGDGVHTLRELVLADERGARYDEEFASVQGEAYHEVVPVGQQKQLTKIGNHCKGTKFLDYSSYITPALVQQFDALAQQIDGFYYGRFDVKVESMEKLAQGEGITVLEVNGVQSEPAHIYDPKNSFIDGIKELFKHRKLMAEISKKNLQKPSTPRVRFLKHIITSKQSVLDTIPVIPPSLGSFDELEDAIRDHCRWQQETYGDISLGRCQYILQRYQGSDRKEYVSFDARHYTRNKVKLQLASELFDIWVIGRSAMQGSGIHDHATQGCIFKVLEGTLTEKRYDKTNNEFILQKQTSLPSGSVAYICDQLGYHDLGNTDSDGTAVSLHIYSPAAHGTTFYSQ